MLQLLKAVSVAEKNPDIATRISIAIIAVVLSIKLKNSPFNNEINTKKHSPKAKLRPGYALLTNIYIHRMSASSILKTFRKILQCVIIQHFLPVVNHRIIPPPSSFSPS